MKNILLIILLALIQFSLNAQCITDNFENNDTYSNAYNLGELTNYATSDLCLETNGQDWFKFTIAGETFYIKVNGYDSYENGPYGLTASYSGSSLEIETTYSTGPNPDTYMYLYINPSDNSIASDDDGGSEGDGTLSKINYTHILPINCNNDISSSYSDAYNIGTSTTYKNENLCLAEDDIDWFKFSYNNSTYYFKVNGEYSSTSGYYGIDFKIIGGFVYIETISSKGSNIDTRLYLYEDPTSSYLTYDDSDGEGSFSLLRYTLNNTNCTTDNLNNNSIESAYDIGTDTIYENNNLCLSGEDWYQFTLNNQTYYFLVESNSSNAYALSFKQSNGTVTIETLQNYDNVYIYLYKDPNSSSLSYDSDYYNSKIEYEFCIDPLEGNNTNADATPITGTTYNNENLCLSVGDEDWFRFTHNSKQYYFSIEYTGSGKIDYGIDFSIENNEITITTVKTNDYLYVDITLYDANASEIISKSASSSYDISLSYEACDSHESNNKYYLAYDLGSRTSFSETQCFHNTSDEDWYTFTFNGETYYFSVYCGYYDGAYQLDFSNNGNTIVINTNEVNNETVDTEIALYGPDHETIIQDVSSGSTDYYCAKLTFESCGNDGFISSAEYAYSLGAISDSSIIRDACFTGNLNDWYSFTYQSNLYYIKADPSNTYSGDEYSIKVVITDNGSDFTIDLIGESTGNTSFSLYLYGANTNLELDYTSTSSTPSLSYDAIFPCTDELESNDQRISAYNLSESPTYSKNDLCLSKGDLDWFKFTTGGSTYYFSVEGGSLSEYDYGLEYTLYAETNTVEIETTGGAYSTDTQLNLYIDNELIASNDNAYSGTCYYCSKIEYTALSIHEAEKTEIEANVYPNPSSDMLYIETLNDNEINSIFLVDALGQLVINKETSGVALIELNVNHLPNGIYYLVLYGNDQRITKKVSIQK